MYARYTWTFLCITAGTLAFIAIINSLLALGPFIYGSANESAASWQAKTRGIASPPDPINEFKIRRFMHDAPHINTVISGSSRILGLDSAITGPNSYNLGISSYPISSSIALTEYAITIAPALRTAYISVDWALGDIFRQTPVGAQLVFPSPRLTTPEAFAILGDSISLPRTIGLATRIVDDARNRHSSLMDVLSTGGTIDAGKCPDGPTAIFGPPAPVDCPGFRNDGSARFDIWHSIETPSLALQAALSPNSVYVESLEETGGKPNPVYLNAIVAIDRKLRARGGHAIVLLPPLMPHLERDMENMRNSGDQLRVFKQAIYAWAASNRIAVIDGGDSMRFGCTKDDFVDAHHAKQSCWAKLFRAYHLKH